MGVDIKVYIDNFTNITKEGCEKYLMQFGLKTQVHPDAKFDTDSGFMPFKVEYLPIDALKDKDFLTGFEIYTDDYDYEQDFGANIKQPPPKKTQGIMGLFKNKRQEANIEYKSNFIINPQADELLKKCNYEVTLIFHELHEGLIASAFASYLAEMGNGVIYNTSSGVYLYENIKQNSYEEVSAFFEELEPEELHLFEEWR